MKGLLLLSVLFLQGCFGLNSKPQPLVETVYIRVPVPGPPVPCKIDRIEPPVDLFMNLKETDDIHYKVKTLLAGRELDKAYRVKLETAINSCNQKD